MNREKFNKKQEKGKNLRRNLNLEKTNQSKISFLLHFHQKIKRILILLAWVEVKLAEKMNT